jgi:hypothetical protein
MSNENKDINPNFQLWPEFNRYIPVVQKLIVLNIISVEHLRSLFTFS